MKTLTALLFTALLAFTAQAAPEPEDDGPVIYRSTDAQGRPVFSDQPSRDAERVNVKEPNRTPAVRPRPRPEPKTSTPDNDSSGYEVQITNPSEGQFVRNGLLGINVSANVHPPMLPKHQLEFLHNGNSVSKGSSYTARIERLTPGGHQISARVLDRDGNVLGQSAPVSVTAQWPGGK
ncbi:hypothetical protein FHR99_002753 [Litorivivens lipolytica]|uniref:DUF4124 domain-containing protein n=1 Tax=Litorivivens lipolytica TaxID=1524264 RepID=A0A7W4W7T1_9GAMM|nr:DUF4124 domain-containing protein [Litorivivens lipolytica]MBB3048479.1 hypothetical protein [Litorivivens lipolytica]